MKYLADTNIFLEVLLKQEKNEACKEFLRSAGNQIYISDFALHSVGVILFKKQMLEAFDFFERDIRKAATVKSLSPGYYPHISTYHKEYSLDFDDAYQLAIATEFALTIKTLDRDFEKAKAVLPIEFI